MRPSVALKAHVEQVREIIHRFDVSNPRVFGSVAHDTSDLDLLVDPGANITFYDLARLQSELEMLLVCKVDVTTPNGLSSDVRRNAAPDFKPLA